MISAVVLARDEERHLPDCLATLHWADEVLVLDSGSRDATPRIAEEAGGRVVHRPFTYYGDQRQAALGLAEHTWLFFVDADERVPPALAEEVRRIVADESRPEVGWWVPRRNYFWGKEVRHSGWAPDHQLRLLRRDAARYDPTQIVHEVAQLDGPAGYLTNSLIHVNYESWGEFWRKQALFARHEGEKLAARGIRWKPWNILLQPLRAFHRRYIQSQGWKDGWLGLRLALAMAWWEGAAYLELRRLTVGSDH